MCSIITAVFGSFLLLHTIQVFQYLALVKGLGLCISFAGYSFVLQA